MCGGSGVLAGAEPAVHKRSDLPVRVASAVVMLAVAGFAFWLGGWFFNAFVLAIVFGVMFEWSQLVLAFERRVVARGLWLLGGAIYLGLAGFTALVLLAPRSDEWPLLKVISLVIAIDVGAYFAGRTFGGPKIAPSISPSKTWSGLAGGISGTLVVFWLDGAGAVDNGYMIALLSFGIPAAIIAQSGDFFESWMKRRAGVKDSGRLIPGHGGLFDRADGLIAVLFVIGVVTLFDRHASPLPFRGGAGGGASALGVARADRPHPNPSPEGEGLLAARTRHSGPAMAKAG